MNESKNYGKVETDNIMKPSLKKDWVNVKAAWPGFDDVVHELDAEPPTKADHLHRRPEGLGEGGVEEAEAKTILQIADGVNEGGIPG